MLESLWRLLFREVVVEEFRREFLREAASSTSQGLAQYASFACWRSEVVKSWEMLLRVDEVADENWTFRGEACMLRRPLAAKAAEFLAEFEALNVAFGKGLLVNEARPVLNCWLDSSKSVS